jgi:hypothetical protein
MTDRWDDLDRAAEAAAPRAEYRHYIALASPDRIRELIARVRRLEEALDDIATTDTFSVTRCSGWIEASRMREVAIAALGDDR